ncbi:MAG: demethylmenaquinone methyltransferase [Nocardiopsaceae bacterium]|nr:demethylmenaquinone methyltransferase [Nocardiopsaceae bacterium]
MTRAELDKRPADVAAMFDAVAGRYDLLNDVLSLGQCRYWRSVVARLVAARPHDVVLDIAAGTGTSSRAFTASGARCIACDFSEGMLRVGASRLGAGPRANEPPDEAPSLVSFVAGDALGLPFADAMFDVVTISFGLRNVADPLAALAEMRRVTKPGGRLVICEFSHLPVRALDGAYQRYLASVLPAVAGGLSPNPAAYAYLAESIRHWPAQEELAGLIRAAGWSSVRWRNLTWGVVAVHVGRNPGGPGRLMGSPDTG